MERETLCKGDKVKLLRCGANARERVARVAFATKYEFIPTVRPWWLLGLVPWPVSGSWWLADEGETWVRS